GWEAPLAFVIPSPPFAECLRSAVRAACATASCLGKPSCWLRLLQWLGSACLPIEDRPLQLALITPGARRSGRPFSRGAFRLFHLDVELVLVPVSGYGEFQWRGLQFLVFRMDWRAARPAFLGQRRRRDQHLVFSFHGAVVVPMCAQLKRAV